MSNTERKYRLTGLGIIVACVVLILGVKASRGFPDSVEMVPHKVRGNPNAKHFIVEYSFFGCGYCLELQPVLKYLLAAFPNDLKIVFKHYPLDTSPKGKACKSAEADECAADQGKFWEYQEQLWANMDEWLAVRNATDNFVKYAKNVGIDPVVFKECLDSGRKREIVLKDVSEGRKFYVQGTPTLVLDGRKILPFTNEKTMKEEIDEVLARDRGAK